MPEGRTTLSARALRIAAVIGLLVSGAVHLKLYLDGYSALPVVGPLFLTHVAASVAVSLWIVVGSRTILPALAGIALEAGALVSLGIAFAGSFFMAAERGMRPLTVVTIVSEVLAVIVLGLLLYGRSRARGSTA